MNAPPRNAIGKMIRLAMEVAACWVLAIAPTSRPIDMNARMPQTTSGIAIHQAAVSRSPKYGSVAMRRNTASWTSADRQAMPILAATIEPVPTGASRSLRSSLFCRQLTSVIAAPKAAPEAIAQPSRPGARYWIGFSDLSSTWLAGSVNAGGWPDGRLVGGLHDRAEHRVHQAGLGLVRDRVAHDEVSPCCSTAAS